MKIKTQLLISNILIITGMIGIIAIMFIFNNISEEYNNLTRQTQQIEIVMNKTSSSLKSVFYTSNLTRGYMDFKEIHEELNNEVNILLSMPLYEQITLETKTDRDNTDHILAILSMSQLQINEINIIIKDLEELYPNNFPGPLRMELTEFKKMVLVDELLKKLEGLSVYFGDVFEYDINKIRQNIEKKTSSYKKNIKYKFTILTIIILFSSVLILSFISYSLKTRIKIINNYISTISTGDLTRHAEVKNTDELSAITSFLNQFTKDFSEIIEKIKKLSKASVKLKKEVSNITFVASTAIDELSQHISSVSLMMTQLIKYLYNSREITANISNEINNLKKTSDKTNTELIEGLTEELTMLNNQISSTGDNINNRMKEIELDTNDINNTMNYINNLNEKSGKTFDDVNIAINRFKTDKI
jgi:methyl-accepting chemotaxis protein